MRVGIATGLCQDFHLGVNTAQAPLGRVRQCEIAVHEDIAGKGDSFFIVRDTGDTLSDPGIRQYGAGYGPAVSGCTDSVVKVNLNFPPAGMAMIG